MVTRSCSSATQGALFKPLASSTMPFPATTSATERLPHYLRVMRACAIAYTLTTSPRFSRKRGSISGPLACSCHVSAYTFAAGTGVTAKAESSHSLSGRFDSSSPLLPPNGVTSCRSQVQSPWSLPSHGKFASRNCRRTRQRRLPSLGTRFRRWKSRRTSTIDHEPQPKSKPSIQSLSSFNCSQHTHKGKHQCETCRNLCPLSPYSCSGWRVSTPNLLRLAHR